MKQKNAAVKGKVQNNASKEAGNLKKPAMNKNQQSAAAVTTGLVTGKVGKAVQKQLKTPPKPGPRSKKAQPVVEEESEDEIEESEEDEELDQEESVGEEEEIEEDADEEDDENEANGSNQVDAEDDSDGEPAEVPIVKKNDSPIKGGIPKINSGNVPKDFPDDQVIVVTNLPQKFKQADIVEVFAKYGSIHTIHPVHGPKTSTAFIAFNTSEAAEASLAANQQAEVKGFTIRVSLRRPRPIAQQTPTKTFEEREAEIQLRKQRTVYVKNLSNEITEAELKEHFGKCGEIESIKLFKRKVNNSGFAYICFEDVANAVAATKLHRTPFNGLTIFVFQNSADRSQPIKDPKRTLLIKNNQHLENFSAEKLIGIFSKHGPIDDVDVLCMKNVLAFITYKDEKHAATALSKLNGTTIDDLQLEIEQYKVLGKTMIFVQNVKPGVTEEELRKLFEVSGPIESISLKKGFAIIKFKDSDGFCKSFLLNESQLRGQMLFLEPYSERKQHLLHHHKGQSGFKRKRERTFSDNNSKKAKI